MSQNSMEKEFPDGNAVWRSVRLKRYKLCYFYK